MTTINLQSSANLRKQSLYDVEKDIDRLKRQAKSLEEFDKSVLKEVLAYLSVDKRKIVKVLDVGCADGLLTFNRFSPYDNVDVLAIDKSKCAIKWAQKNHATPHIHFSPIDILSPQPWELSFDFIFCSYLLPHVADQMNLLRILWSYLKPQGILFVRAGDDGWKVTFPFSKELEWILSHTSLIPGISDRQCGRKIPFYLQSLIPLPSRIQAYNFLETTLGLGPEQKGEFFRQYYGFRSMYLEKALKESTEPYLLQYISQMKEYLQKEEERFLQDKHIYSMVTHVSFIAHK